MTAENGENEENKDASYYARGSSEIAKETPLTLRRLEPRRQLTKDSTRLVIALVGLPARGKSFVARKLVSFMQWNGIQCKIFNVGKYRRQAYAEVSSSSGQCDADFFDTKNEQAAALREKVADLALRDMLRWLDDEDGIVLGNGVVDTTERPTDLDSSRRSVTSTSTVTTQHDKSWVRDKIAIFDATNSTNKRRNWLLEECTSPAKRPGKPTGMVFVESICDDQELLEENYQFKISHSPDYAGLNKEESMADLRRRVKKYEEAYETITDDSLSYIKIFNLSTKLLVNHIYGRMSKVIVPALMAWNIGTRPVFLCRPGQTLSDITTDGEDYVSKVDVHDPDILELSAHAQKRMLRGDTLGPMGRRFSDALFEYLFEEGNDFLLRRASTMDMAHTGTSMTGIAPPETHKIGDTEHYGPPFPLKIFTSTMPRALETVRWDEYQFKVEELSNLNPLDKGDFAGKELEEIQSISPSWYSKLERNAFHTRFPGGESYRDLIRRLDSVIVDIEQQVIPTLIVSHVSILQALISYFRASPVEDCMSIEVPLHTVMKFTPVRGGGWSESQHPLLPGSNISVSGDIPSDSEVSNSTYDGDNGLKSPIWGDHVRRASSMSLSSKVTL